MPRNNFVDDVMALCCYVADKNLHLIRKKHFKFSVRQNAENVEKKNECSPCVLRACVFANM